MTWLAPTLADRERLMDMDRRLRPMQVGTVGIAAVGLTACGFWIGFWPLAPLAVFSLVVALFRRGDETQGTPEVRVAARWCLTTLMIAVAVAVADDPHLVLASWLVIPVVTLPARFGPRGLIAGSVFAAASLIGATLVADPGAVAHAPQLLIAPLTLLAAVATMSAALMSSDRQHRSAAVIDSLTGMLNRGALDTRARELEQQAVLANQPVSLILGDIDGFKEINDRYGHATGDAVLQEVASRIRTELRAFDLAYRMGGEEFLVVLPGASAEQTLPVVESLRRVIAAAPVGEVRVTMSFGVASSEATDFEFDAVFAQADRAVYAAKAAGRNCVEIR